MRASEVLQKCLGDALGGMHALRSRVLLRAVEAMISGRRLTLMDLARAWPDAQRVRAPLKALDRLLGNAHLHAERVHLYAGMMRWLVRNKQPLIMIDWSDLKADRSWHLLRAAIAVGGRTLPILDMVFPAGQQGSPGAEKQFLQQLARVISRDVRPLLVTDAGFRGPWFRAVDAMGWQWVGRLRNTTKVKPVDVPDEPSQWVPCKAIYEMAGIHARDLGAMHIAQSNPLIARMILHAKLPKGRKHRNRLSVPARNSNSRKSASREAEPWLLIASPDLTLTAQQLMRVYAKRMQIEESFRDLKSHRFGQAFEDSLTRKGPRIEILLLLSALAAFAAWLVGIACEAIGIDQWMAPFRSKRRLYSLVRVGHEALMRGWLKIPISRLIEHLRHPSPEVLEQLGSPT